jgi:signal peptidase I
MEYLKKLMTGFSLRSLNPKAVKQTLWIIALTGLFIFLNNSPSLMAMAGNSMEPVFTHGDLIYSRNIQYQKVQAGDIIVVKVPPVFQDKYDYPTLICRRVISLKISGQEISFRTRGDNSGEDPFLTPVENLVGTEVKSFPLAGYSLMFAQSNQGKYILAGSIILWLLYMNRRRLLNVIKNARYSISGISTTEFVKAQSEMETKMRDMTVQVTQSMNGFSAAMSEYAVHIASHTGAIKSLAEAAKHMESILSKQDAALSNGIPREVVLKTPESDPQLPVLQMAVEVTPELKSAVREFIFAYNLEHGISSLVVTPDLRTAVWNFIQEYVKNPPLPEPGAYLSAIKTVKITPENVETDSEESATICTTTYISE